MANEKTDEEVKKEGEENLPKPRQVILETDGNNVKVIAADVAGKIELIGILEMVINHLKNNKT